MSGAGLTIDLEALTSNWRALDAASGPATRTGAVVKADAYGLGVAKVGRALLQAGVDTFFVALAEEGAQLRSALGPGPEIFVFAGHMDGDADILAGSQLTPLLNSAAQLARHLGVLSGHRFGVQLDTGMNRLGMEPDEWQSVRARALEHGPALLMSHLACADEPDHPMNRQQLARFHEMTSGLDVPRSLAATGGILLGADYHLDLTRPGIGLYGGAPFHDARPVVHLSVPVIQTRRLTPGETVGYANSWTAPGQARIATVAAGYADGLPRALSNRATLFADGTPCPLVGRVSMDLITVDISGLGNDPEQLDLICPQQGIDALAAAADTIGYEILTGLGTRYARHYKGAQ